ncbi:MAG TPA: YdbH domain-containing protein [Sphingomicrobium sp.]|nr:YdbH domain-containing protein [Sphingomicrobium sp.]
MNERRRDEATGAPEPAHATIVRRRAPLWARAASVLAIAILLLLFAAIIIIWIQRRPIATHYLRGEFARRGVTASYHLDRVGLRTQEVSNLVIGDPKRPDLVARFARIETRLRWNGNFDVYRIVARGVRLRGRLMHGRVSWGQIDKLMPPPSNKPFALPNFALDVADSSIALVTPFGPLGIAVDGNGKLSGGFKGHAAIVSPRLIPGRCAAVGLRATLAIGVVARKPQVAGPVALDQFTCPLSRFDVASPRFDAKASFNESFSNVNGSGRMAIATLTAGANGLADFAGTITYKGWLNDVDGRVNLAAQRSRMATVTAQRTGLNGRYHLGIANGTFSLAGGFAVDDSTLDPKMLDSVTEPLAAAASTPVGAVVASISNAIGRTASRFSASGQIKVVNFPGGGAARITRANVNAPSGARAMIAGGTGITYYWPAGGLRVDSTINMAGGGLPQGRVTLHQPRAGAPMSGVAEIAPYAAGGQRLSLSPVVFGPGPAGSTALSTTAELDGLFPGGRVQALRLPIAGRIGPGGGFAFGTSCAVVSFEYLQTGTLQLGPARLPVCPLGPAIIFKRPGTQAIASAQITNPILNGKLGSSPLHIEAAHGEFAGKQFMFDRLAAQLGHSTSPVLIDAAHFTGSFANYLHGEFKGGRASIGKVPLILSDAVGSWLYRNKILSVRSALTLSDRDPNPRFYPLHSDNVRFTLAGNEIRATGDLRHPASGTLVTSVQIQHHLKSGSGSALLDVPGLTFGPNLQPEQLTRLTEGVVALVNGTVAGRGRIDWAEGGKVTSTGDFSTRNMNLAAPFGPVTGLTTSVHFDDLLGLSTPSGQVMTVATVNPGISVSDGVIRYQLLPHNRVKIERGEWPFMGGKLVLDETTLDFSHHAPKQLTFELEGFYAKMFVDSLGFAGFSLSGTFDGKLPMVFDENGGRIVGGVLTSRPPGGELKYSGTKPGGLVGGLAFDLLSDIRYRSMVIRLDGDLSGEFATRLTIDQVSLGPGHGIVASLVHRAFRKLPLKLNVNINGPFRALIQMAKSFKDPTEVIAPVMPFPIDSPALKVDVLSSTKNEQPASPPKRIPAPNQSPPPGDRK